MNYISRLPQSSFSAKILCRALPVSISNSAPSGPPKRRHAQISRSRTFPLSTVSLPLLPLFFSLPARPLPSDSPAPPTDLDQAMLSRPCHSERMTHLSSCRRHSYLVCLVVPPIQCRSTTYGGRIYTYTAYLTVIALPDLHAITKF